MGRRALRKIDPALDLSKHFKTPEEMPQPWNPEAIFARSAPLEIEVGSGKGLFLRSIATAKPEQNYLGIEVAEKYAQFSAAMLLKRNLENAMVLHGDALRFFREVLPDACLKAVHVYFPDPCWKTRHRKRRVMCESFLRDIQRTLWSGGELHFWTDVEEYFETTLELIPRCTTLVGPLEVAEKEADHDLDYRTHFERRMRKLGLPIYRSEYRKE